MIVAVVGNPFDGLEIYGPFADHEQATSWCERLDYEEWNVADVESPREQSDCPPENAGVLDEILDLCEKHGLVYEAISELHCIEDSGCRSSQM